jgi:hypothetical protein
MYYLAFQIINYNQPHENFIGSGHVNKWHTNLFVISIFFSIKQAIILVHLMTTESFIAVLPMYKITRC